MGNLMGKVDLFLIIIGEFGASLKNLPHGQGVLKMNNKLSSNLQLIVRIKWFSFVRIAGLCSVSYHFFSNAYSGGFIGVDIFFFFRIFDYGFDD